MKRGRRKWWKPESIRARDATCGQKCVTSGRGGGGVIYRVHARADRGVWFGFREPTCLQWVPSERGRKPPGNRRQVRAVGRSGKSRTWGWGYPSYPDRTQATDRTTVTIVTDDTIRTIRTRTESRIQNQSASEPPVNYPDNITPICPEQLLSIRQSISGERQAIEYRHYTHYSPPIVPPIERSSFLGLCRRFPAALPIVYGACQSLSDISDYNIPIASKEKICNMLDKC